MTSLKKIAVLDYGIGNLRSAQKALEHLGVDAELTASRSVVEAADAVVLPGVGAFGACMDALRGSGLDTVAVEAVSAGTPFLGICVGMQMLYEGSDESPDVTGLGIVPGQVRRLPEGVLHPQMQWNRLEPVDPDHAMFRGMHEPWVYFVHSYAPEASPIVCATCDYGGPVTAAIAHNSLWATQFHPEKSGEAGLQILDNFVSWVGGRS